jgi:8-oxo-dGTP pyrophosphatase MutT (NUDIX family)
VERRQRIAAYGICTDAEDRLLLVRASAMLTVAGRWFLPGGGLEHGEAPLDGLKREVGEETGLRIGATTLTGVLSDLSTLPDRSLLHTVRIIYRVETWTGDLRAEATGSSDAVQWFAPEDLAEIPLAPYVRVALEEFGTPSTAV